MKQGELIKCVWFLFFSEVVETSQPEEQKPMVSVYMARGDWTRRYRTLLEYWYYNGGKCFPYSKTKNYPHRQKRGGCGSKQNLDSTPIICEVPVINPSNTNCMQDCRLDYIRLPQNTVISGSWLRPCYSGDLPHSGDLPKGPSHCWLYIMLQ